MFVKEDVIEARQKPFEERLTAAQAIKDEGNAGFRAGDYLTASLKYEYAAAVFKWCENTNPDWKKKGIRDEVSEDTA